MLLILMLVNALSYIAARVVAGNKKKLTFRRWVSDCKENNNSCAFMA